MKSSVPKPRILKRVLLFVIVGQHFPLYGYLGTRRNRKLSVYILWVLKAQEGVEIIVFNTIPTTGQSSPRNMILDLSEDVTMGLRFTGFLLRDLT